MTKIMIIGIVVIAAITLTAYSAFSADYSRYSTEELSQMRGTMQNATSEEREMFRNEWQNRIQNMTQEERQEYMGKPFQQGSGSGMGMKQKQGTGKDMEKAGNGNNFNQTNKENTMKKIWIIGIAAVFALTAMVTLSDAGPWKGWKGSGGWGYKSQYQRMYNPQSVVEVKGVVEDIEQITPTNGMSYGIHLKVKTDTETVAVHLGPSWFIERQDISIEKGDMIEVKGSKIIFNESPAIIAAEVDKGDTELRLRDDNGFPVWAGSGMGRMRRY